MHELREATAAFIAFKAAEGDTAALSWVLQRAVVALMDCYPPGEGKAAVLRAVRVIVGSGG